MLVHVDADARTNKLGLTPQMVHREGRSFRLTNLTNDRGCCGGAWLFMWVWSEGPLSPEPGVYVAFCHQWFRCFFVVILGLMIFVVPRTNADVCAIPELLLDSTADTFSAVQVSTPAVSCMTKGSHLDT